MDYPFLIQATVRSRVTLIRNVAAGGGGALYAMCTALGPATTVLDDSVAEVGGNWSLWKAELNAAGYGAFGATQMVALKVSASVCAEFDS